ncbi:hypothetical protein QWZ10_19175 [Paracoccus cavernae]|uniref:Uncharacterized protein n=1 Tax=Paracoccus cavernae TaxID=1571207 RepID=A0ABT8DAM0_9RHOB|nr:hypothetical protein [Paracoccus cavernae]
MEWMFIASAAVMAAVAIMATMLRSGRERTALVLRIENAAELRRSLGMAGMAELMGRIMQLSSQILGSEPGSAPDVRADGAGICAFSCPTSRCPACGAGCCGFRRRCIPASGSAAAVLCPQSRRSSCATPRKAPPSSSSTLSQANSVEAARAGS